jgi:hypothetical protein
MFLASLGCGKRSSATAGDSAPAASAVANPSASAGSAASAPSASSALASIGDGQRESAELGSVYPKDAGVDVPVAKRACAALLLRSAERAARCCGGATPVMQSFAGECARMLGVALGDHAVEVSDAAITACEAAIDRATTGCDWVTPMGASLPPECAFIEGRLAVGARCRSSLECQRGLQCQGLSAIDRGVCARPKPDGAVCELATDVLVANTAHADDGGAHPECEGRCSRHRCMSAVADGGRCATDAECQSRRCLAGACTRAPLPGLDAACKERCERGLRCSGGKCEAPRAEGERCEGDAECRASCRKGPSGGHCLGTCPNGAAASASVHAAQTSPL